MNICIGGFSFHNTMVEGRMDTFSYLEASKYRYRLQAVDLWNGSFPGIRENIFSLPDESFVEKLRLAIIEREMQVINFAVDGAHIWDADADKRAMLYRNAETYMHIAHRLGAHSIRLDTGDHQSEPESEEQFAYTVEKFTALSHLAGELGLIVGPENHMGSSKNPHYLRRIAQTINHPSFGILLHMDRWAVDAENGDKLVAPYVYHTHFDGKTVGTERGLELAKMLLEEGYEGYWGIEYNAPKQQYIEMEWAIASVKRMLTNV